LSKFFKAFLGMLFLATYVTVSPQAFASTTTVGMPFSGKWAYNVNVNPPYDDSNSSHPSVHWTNATTQYLWGDWASDFYASEGTPVSLHVTSNDGTVSFNAGTLWFIKTKNTGSGHVEVHSATLGSGYQGGQH
jgi:hypothetical protein